MAENFDAIRRLKDLGVSDPNRLSASDIKLLLDAYLKNKSLNTDAFKAVVSQVPASLRVIFEGLKAFSNDQAQVAKGVLEIIRDAIKLIETELARGNLSPEERVQLRSHVFGLVEKAREEGDKNRNFLLKLAGIGASALTILGGIAVAVAARRGGQDKSSS